MRWALNPASQSKKLSTGQPQWIAGQPFILAPLPKPFSTDYGSGHPPSKHKSSSKLLLTQQSPPVTAAAPGTQGGGNIQSPLGGEKLSWESRLGVSPSRMPRALEAEAPGNQHKFRGSRGLQAYIWQGQRLQHPGTHSYILNSENKIRWPAEELNGSLLDNTQRRQPWPPSTTRP